jgi:hypothetical protein
MKKLALNPVTVVKARSKMLSSAVEASKSMLQRVSGAGAPDVEKLTSDRKLIQKRLGQASNIASLAAGSQQYAGIGRSYFNTSMNEARATIQQNAKKGLIASVNKVTQTQPFPKLAERKQNKYTSLEYTVASGNPFVKALTRNMPVDKQKAVWRRYAQIVMRNRNYGRKGNVAGEYIKNDKG